MKADDSNPLIWTPGQESGFDWRHLEAIDKEHHPGQFRSLKDYQQSRMKHVPTEQVRQTTPELDQDKETE